MKWTRFGCALLCAASMGVVAEELPPLPVVLIGNIDRIDFPEPSGITYHAARKTLFVVSDEGHLCEIETDGAPVRSDKIAFEGTPDFEGVTVDPSSGLLYVAVEGLDEIAEINPDTFAVTRRFPIRRTMEAKTIIAEGGQGIEGIAFVADDHHPEGGVFYVTNQGFADSAPDDRSAILEVVAPIRTGGDQAVIERVVPFDMGDLSDLHYDAGRDLLIAISDSNNALVALRRSGERLAFYALPGEDQEGITADADEFIYIAQDSGGILKLRRTDAQ
ncbi:MAG: SdiA-regulated domain-containing protein [Candidatus Poribacteria bacterium]|nr:SdiA-regulated domain-containing protein [Candidatus Poribacteria bacterium]